MWNEEEMLPMWVAQLRAIPQVKQIILVDTGSTDKSVDIARALVDHVEIMDFEGFAAARNKAIQMATCDWLAVQWDIDEMFSKDFPEYLNSLNGGDSYRIPFYDGIFDTKHLAFNRNSGCSSKYLMHKSTNPRYVGVFPESFQHNGKMKTIGHDPIRSNIRSCMMHARFLKCWIRAINRDTSVITQEGLTRLRYFVNRTWKWEESVAVGPEYIKQAENEFAEGNTSKVDYIGYKEFEYHLLQTRDIKKQDINDIIMDVAKPFPCFIITCIYGC